MNKTRRLVIAGMGGTAVCLAAISRRVRAADTARAPVPPKVARRAKRIEQLGRVRVDEYAWLRDPDWKRVALDPSRMQPEIRTHLEAENRYAEAILAPTKKRQAEYVAAMNALASKDEAAPAAPDGPWEYYQYLRAGEDHPVHARRPRGGGREQIVFDEQARAAAVASGGETSARSANGARAYYRIVEPSHSPDDSLFLWAEDLEGGDRYRICVRDLATGEIRTATSDEAFGISGVVFSPCSKWIFWLRRDAHGRPTTLLRQPSRGGADTVVYEEKDPALFMSLKRTASNRFVALRISGPDLDEVRLIPADDPTATPTLVEPRKVGVHYQVEEWRNQLILLTDADEALDGKLMRASPDAPSRNQWRDWIPHRPGCQILEVRAFQDHFVRLQRVEGKLEVVVTSADGAENAVVFDEEAHAVELDPLQDFASTNVRLLYQSPRTPMRWIEYDAATRRQRVIQQQSTGRSFSATHYEVRRLTARAKDGESIPVTVLLRKGTRLDGKAPLLLYAYGSYGVSTEATFSVPHLALVDKGWIFAIAHVRGGSEKGRRWFLDGRRFHKANTFTDFIACAEHLIAQRYTRARRIVAQGLSAGGLLMGAVSNLRPELWAGVIAQVPFVDMLNTMSDADHPLVPLFRPDWGDPLADTQAYDYIASISPYENVKSQAYPPILSTAGIRDGRVSYWEPAKWIANVRYHSTSQAPAMLLTDMASGHQIAAGRSDQFRQMAQFWAFADWSIAQGANRGE
jgi:oligopeptidase B